jgi:hypothetical protein
MGAGEPEAARAAAMSPSAWLGWMLGGVHHVTVPDLLTADLSRSVDPECGGGAT